MDHFRQIPQVGRAWDDILESFTTLAWLAACTTRVRLGALVAGVTYRNVGHLAKIVATLDVLSGGRAVCGLGLGWFAAGAPGVRVAFPPAGDRYALLEDALQRCRCSGGRAASRSGPGAGRAGDALLPPAPAGTRADRARRRWRAADVGARRALRRRGQRVGDLPMNGMRG